MALAFSGGKEKREKRGVEKLVCYALLALHSFRSIAVVYSGSEKLLYYLLLLLPANGIKL